MDRAGHAMLYSWRPTDQGSELWRRTFTGNLNQPAALHGEKGATIPGRAVRSVANVIAERATSHALVGWVEESLQGTTLGVASIEAGQVRVVRSDPIPSTSPFPRQRLGIWGRSWDCVELCAVVQSDESPASYSLARFSIGQNLPNNNGVWWIPENKDLDLAHASRQPLWQKRSLEVTKLDLKPGTLHAAATDHFKMRSELALSQFFLTTDGRLLRSYKIGRGIRQIGHGVSLDNPLAVITSSEQAFFGTRHPDGSLTLRASTSRVDPSPRRRW
jgi:hypothetical protein